MFPKSFCNTHPTVMLWGDLRKLDCTYDTRATVNVCRHLLDPFSKRNQKSTQKLLGRMMVYSRAFGLDQWVASILRHVSLGIGVKKDNNPQSCDGRMCPCVLLSLSNGSRASGGMLLEILHLEAWYLRSWRWGQKQQNPPVLCWKLVCQLVTINSSRECLLMGQPHQEGKW